MIDVFKLVFVLESARPIAPCDSLLTMVCLLPFLPSHFDAAVIPNYIHDACKIWMDDDDEGKVTSHNPCNTLR